MTAENEEVEDVDARLIPVSNANLTQDLVENFSQLPMPIQLVSAQAGLAKGIIHCFVSKKKALQSELLNITDIDPIKLATQYMLLRQQLLLVDEVIDFYSYLTHFFNKHTGQDEDQQPNGADNA